MKRLLPALPALLALLLAAGCAAPAEMDAPSTEPEAPAPITADSLRAEYEAQDFQVREIIPYEGDFLVYYGTEPCNGGFQWVYADTGLHAPLLFSPQEVLDHEIEFEGRIRVLTGGSNMINGFMSFPSWRSAAASLPLTQEGETVTDAYQSGSVQQETYWAALDRSYAFGWDHGSVALVEVRVTANGVDAVFGPTAANLGGFFAAASSIPVTQTSYDSSSHTMTLRFQNTALTSGERTAFADEAERKNYTEYAALYHLPTVLPAGAVAGSNDFIKQAEVRQDGADTLLVLTLTELTEQYTVECDQLLKNESRPYLHLALRETRDW